MRIEILVDAAEFWPALRADIEGARDRVYLQALSYEGDAVGLDASQTLIASAAADRRVIADEFYTRYRINDSCLHNPRHWFDRGLRAERDATLAMMRDLESRGVRVRLTNPARPLLLRAFSRNHKKMIVIDDRVAYIGGMNFTEHNFAWHDMMLRIEDPDVARYLAQDFLATWEGRHLNGSRSFDNLDIYRFDARRNRCAFVPILDRISSARHSVYIESPYVTYPFCDALRRARRRGARVTLVTPERNNWRFLKEYATWEAARSGFEVRLYHGRMMHSKAMLIDGTHLIVGSSNFDILSCVFMQEIVAVITDGDTIARFRKKVLEPDLAASTAVESHVPAWKGYAHLMRLKVLSGVFAPIHSILSTRR